MVEHLLDTQNVVGSIPTSTTKDKWSLSSIGRALALHARGTRFETARDYQKTDGNDLGRDFDKIKS